MSEVKELIDKLSQLPPGVVARMEELAETDNYLTRETFLEIIQGRDAEQILSELILWFDITKNELIETVHEGIV